MTTTLNVTGARHFARLAVGRVVAALWGAALSSTALSSAVLSGAALSSTALAGGTVLNVPAEYATIQLAINAAPAGSVVLVAAGTYSQGFSLIGKNVVVRGAINGGTILDGAALLSSIAEFKGNEPATAGIEHLVFRNGLSGCLIGGVGLLFGGGSVCGVNSSAHISNCRFENSRSDVGGGVYLGNCNINIDSCKFTGNSAGIDGGGLFLEHCSGTVLGCNFTSNSCGVSSVGMSNGSGSAIRIIGAKTVGGIVTLNNCTVGCTVGNTIDCPTAGNTAAASGSAIDFSENPKFNRGILKIIGGSITGNHSGAAVFTGAGGLRVNGQMTSCVLSGGASICNNFAKNVSGPYRVLDSASVCECHGDVTNDGVVNAADLSLVLARWGTAVNAFGEADATHDGVINAADVSMVLAMCGTCPG
jgi:hypothetical protein